MPIRIVIADDHPIYRDGLARSLEEVADFEIVGQAASADEAVELVTTHHPDLVLLDISMPGSGIQAATRIAAAAPKVRIAMLTVSENDSDVMAALKAGASGYVLKGISASELVVMIRDIAAGRNHIAPDLAANVLNALNAAKSAPDPVADLTKREEEILRLVAKGQSNKEVANALNLQEKTVKHYMTAVLQKLKVRNRVEAALIAREAWGS